MKNTNPTFRIVITALFAALVTVATMLIHVPTPGTGGYVNLGDGIILLCAFLLSPVQAFAAGGLGSMLADILSGYAVYAPGTLVVKGLTGLIACLLAQRLFGGTDRRFVARLIAAVVAEVFMAMGYFAYESTLLGYGIGAAASIPANLIQGLAGVIVAMVLTPVLLSSKELRELFSKL